MTDARALREGVEKRLLWYFSGLASKEGTADEVIALVLEEAARCAEDYAGTGMEIDYIRQSGDASRTRSDIAAAIRALKEKQ